MWYYKDVETYYYIDGNYIVWRVWTDGLVLKTDQDADVTANLLKRIDRPYTSWANKALRKING